MSGDYLRVSDDRAERALPFVIAGGIPVAIIHAQNLLHTIVVTRLVEDDPTSLEIALAVIIFYATYCSYFTPRRPVGAPIYRDIEPSVKHNTDGPLMLKIQKIASSNGRELAEQLEFFDEAATEQQN
eukprot:scaffold288327_cov17-Prasinocladus_malaysianus.AAC.2